MSLGDNVRHYVYIDPSVPVDLANAMRRVLASAYEPSVLVLLEDSSITYRTDVIVLPTTAPTAPRAGPTVRQRRHRA